MNEKDFCVALDVSDKEVMNLITKEFKNIMNIGGNDDAERVYRDTLMEKVCITILSNNSEDCVEYELFGGYIRDSVGGYEPVDIDVIVITDRENSSVEQRNVQFSNKVEKLLNFLKNSIGEILSIDSEETGKDSFYNGYKAYLHFWSPFHKNNDLTIKLDLVMDTNNPDIDFDVNSLYSQDWDYLNHDARFVDMTLDELINEKIKKKQFNILHMWEMDDFGSHMEHQGSSAIARMSKKAMRVGKMIQRGWTLENRNDPALKNFIFPCDQAYKDTVCSNCENKLEDSDKGFIKETPCCKKTICFSCINQKSKERLKDRYLSFVCFGKDK